MKKVFLYGELGRHLGNEWELEVNSVQEALWAIEANTGKLTSFFRENQEKFGHYTFKVNNKTLTNKEELESNLPDLIESIHIMPQVSGGGMNIITWIVISIVTGLIMQLQRSLHKTSQWLSNS